MEKYILVKTSETEENYALCQYEEHSYGKGGYYFVIARHEMIDPLRDIKRNHETLEKYVKDVEAKKEDLCRECEIQFGPLHWNQSHQFVAKSLERGDQLNRKVVQ
jgi:hypothetical protein